MAKIVYDFDEKYLSKKVYLEKDDGTRHHYPFFKIELYDGFEHPQIKCWKTQKEMNDYFKKHPEKDATPKNGVSHG